MCPRASSFFGGSSHASDGGGGGFDWLPKRDEKRGGGGGDREYSHTSLYHLRSGAPANYKSNNMPRNCPALPTYMPPRYYAPSRPVSGQWVTSTTQTSSSANYIYGICEIMCGASQIQSSIAKTPPPPPPGPHATDRPPSVLLLLLFTPALLPFFPFRPIGVRCSPVGFQDGGARCPIRGKGGGGRRAFVRGAWWGKTQQPALSLGYEEEGENIFFRKVKILYIPRRLPQRLERSMRFHRI